MKQYPFHPPVYYCRRAHMPLTLDGRLDKPFWADIPFTDLFVDIEGPEKRKPPRFPTRAKAAWDDGALYLAAELTGDEIWAHVARRDDVIFHDNDFEVFIDPDSDTQRYIELEMNAMNTVWDLLLTKAYRDGGKPIDSFDIKGLETAVYIDGKLNDPCADNRKWSVEIKLPMRSLKEAADRVPRPGDYWRLNFSRVQWTCEVKDGEYRKVLGPDGKPLPEDNWVWAPTGVIDIHRPQYWGFLFFTENGEEYPIPEDERLRFDLYRLFEEQRVYYREHGCYSTDVDALRAAAGVETRPVIETTAHFFEMRVKRADGRGEIRLFADGRSEMT
ncbi:MAG: carbohydrate-binding family 9-like protein [Clostridia bacterium]|nr:carbohydrate-binding family 9-like protein [Clostridia bacterium]